MRETPSPFLNGLAGRWLRAAEVGLAAAFLALYAYTAIRRVSFPFDLNWGEGAFVDHVVRLVKRQQLYVAPSINFTPFVYTPGYCYVHPFDDEPQGNAKLVAGCGDSEKQLIRFVGPDTPTPGATTFIACLGATIH